MHLLWCDTLRQISTSNLPIIINKGISNKDNHLNSNSIIMCKDRLRGFSNRRWETRLSHTVAAPHPKPTKTNSKTSKDNTNPRLCSSQARPSSIFSICNNMEEASLKLVIKEMAPAITRSPSWTCNLSKWTLSLLKIWSGDQILARRNRLLHRCNRTIFSSYSLIMCLSLIAIRVAIRRRKGGRCRSLRGHRHLAPKISIRTLDNSQ